MGNEWEPARGSLRDGRFGQSIAPASFANCFANLFPTNELAPPVAGNDIVHLGTKRAQNLSKGPTVSTSRHDPPLPNYSDLSSDSSIYTHPVYDQAYQDPEDNSMCNAIFACDTPFQFPSTWQPTHLDVSRPPVPQASMTYSQQRNLIPTDQIVSPTNLNPESSATAPLARVVPQPTLEKMSPSWDVPSSDCPLIDFSIDDDSNRPKRGPFKDPTDRAQTAQTRKDNACVRCKMQRTRCIPDPFDPRGVCLTCKKVANTRVVNLPCLRYKIPDTRLFREGYVPDLIWSRRWDVMEMNDVSTWADSETRCINITQDYSPNPVTLRVRKFIPVEGDSLVRKWKHEGMPKSVTLPPYAIESLKEAERAYRDYISREGTKFFMSTLDKEDPLIFDTYSMAINASKNHMSEQERILLNMVLRLWVAVRMLCRSERIVGNDRLDISLNLMDHSSPMYGKTPIPPVMGAQIELVLIQGILNPLRAMILEQLQKLILAHKPQNWFCIYLCTFILLHNASLITKQDITYARKHGLMTKFSMPDMIAELHTGANILLAYFQYCCKGHRPFSLDWNAEKSLSMAALDPYQVKFIQKTALQVQANESRYREIRKPSSCDHEHYFISQLFEQDWEPRGTDE
ncbi:hypothetical protein BKA65DRAFT_547760 [Rhexocercosporidium sp. MPI-PUGE-AT-0058]|nr:hypothetical protein BKA65DRAFT_547760 [Rhexocercosporidium sp. MPI-PUGE-AT-0058]